MPMPLSERPNVWRWLARRRIDGVIHPAAPGREYFVSRGPTSKDEMIYQGRILLSGIMRNHYDKTGVFLDIDVDPASVIPLGESEQTKENVGLWRPPGAVPVDLPLVEHDDEDEDDELPRGDDRRPSRAAAGNKPARGAKRPRPRKRPRRGGTPGERVSDHG